MPPKKSVTRAAPKRASPADHSVVDPIAPSQAGTSTLLVRAGPLPTPEELFQYHQLLPGAADRIIAMAEREQAHRINSEDMATRADIRHRDETVAAQREVARGAFMSDLVGQFGGIFIGAGCIAGAVYTAHIGANPLVSIALVSLPVASIIKAIRAMSGAQPPARKR